MANAVQFGPQPFSDEGPVAQARVEFGVLDQGFRPDEVIPLTADENEPARIPQHIYQRHDLGGQSSALPSDPLTISPPPHQRPARGPGRSALYHGIFKATASGLLF